MKLGTGTVRAYVARIINQKLISLITVERDANGVVYKNGTINLQRTYYRVALDVD